MADGKLNGKRVAVLATDGVEQSELIKPKEALEEQGATATVVSPKPDKIKGWDVDDWDQEIKVDRTLDKARVDDFDALLGGPVLDRGAQREAHPLPGGALGVVPGLRAVGESAAAPLG